MAEYSFELAPKGVQDFLTRAREEQINLIEVCKELEHFGISSIKKMVLISDGLGVPFASAKEAVSEFESQSGGGMEKSLIQAIDEAITDQ